MEVPPKAIYPTLHTCLRMGWVTLGKCLFLSISFNCIAVVEYYHDSTYWGEKSSTGKLPASWQLHWDVADCHTGKWSILGQCNALQAPRVNCIPCGEVCKQKSVLTFGLDKTWKMKPIKEPQTFLLSMKPRILFSEDELPDLCFWDFSVIFYYISIFFNTIKDIQITF